MSEWERKSERESDREAPPISVFLPELFFSLKKGEKICLYWTVMSLDQCQMLKRVWGLLLKKKKPKRYLKILVTKLSFRLLRWIPWLRVLCFQGTDLYKNYRCVHFPLIDLLRPGWLVPGSSLTIACCVYRLPHPVPRIKTTPNT